MGLISGVLGAGGLFGISRMAQNVSNGQTATQRIGSSYGGTKAAQQTLGNIFDVPSLISQIQESQMGNHVMLMKLEQFGGLKRSEWQGKEAADVAIPVARALKEAFLRMPANIRGLPGAYGIYAPQGVGLQELTQNSVQDQGSLAKMYAQFKKQDALDASTQQAWTNFVKKMEAIGTQLENLFAKSLKTLSGPLSDFAKSLVKATGIILDSPLMKNIIKGAGRVVESGAKYLASPQFEKIGRASCRERV